MAPLDTLDVAVRAFNATVLVLIIVVNAMQRAHPTTPISAYMWREHPFLTELGLAFLGLLAVMSYIDLGVHFGWLPEWVASAALPLIGIPIAVSSVLILLLGTRAALRGWRSFEARRAGGPDEQRR